ncbi:hypothetical protein K8O93_00655 [Gordonia bronchialis]|uniref:hypothetical protein n=1 Tax=Gordonia bronchialis TaxID=2054 RepID=UPI001CBA81D5|nr:hypothetical protein [Gordonia bronchialis]UAK38343.1 hypothetical protein K8O93_00655 [Gordonia bronchialis]
MRDLHLSEDDLARLAMALAPLLMPVLRNQFGEIAVAVANEVGVERVLTGEFDTDVAIATVLDHIRRSDERRFASIVPVDVGTLREEHE